MTWVAILAWVIIHIPDFIAIIKAIISLLSSSSFSQRNSYREMISEAIKTRDKELVKSCLSVCHAVLQKHAA